MLFLTALGVLAGLITTLTGFGGGFFLVTSLALLWDPLSALTISSCALLIGNGQRLYLFRHTFDWTLALPVLLGSIPGALTGALIATSLPIWVLQAAIVLASVGSFVQLVVKRGATLPRWVLAPGAGLIGLLSATTGGGGFLMGPLLLSAGAAGSRYIAVGAGVGVAIHSFRLLGYSHNGLIDESRLGSAAVIALAIVVGNYAGRGIRLRVGERSMRWVEYGAPILCAGLAIAGL